MRLTCCIVVYIAKHIYIYKVDHFRRHHIMEIFNITYSKKNIVIPSENKYKLKLIIKTKIFLKRMHWKALVFLGKLKSSDKDNYGFKR